MTDDHLSTIYTGELVMGIDTSRLVLSEIDRILHLADVMIECASTHQLRIGTNLTCYLGSKVSHLNTMLESAWSHLTHTSQQVLIHVAQLNQRNIRDESEELLYQIKQGIATEDDDATNGQIDIFAAVDASKVIMKNHEDGQIRNHRHHSCDDSRPEQLRTAGQFTQGEHRGETSHQLYSNKLERLLKDRGTDKYHRDMRHQSGARIHEYTDKHRNDGKRQHEYMEHRMIHQNRCHRCSHDNKGINHADRTHASEIVLAIKRQIECKERNDNQNQKSFTAQFRQSRVDICVSTVHLFQIRVDNLIGLRRDNLSLTHNLLSALHHADSQRHAVEQIKTGRLTTILVISEVWFQKDIEVYLLEHIAIKQQLRSLQELLIDLTGCRHLDSRNLCHLPVVNTS